MPAAPIEPIDKGPHGAFLKLLEIDARDAREHPDTLARIRSGALHGALLRNVYQADLLQTVVERLTRHDPPFVKSWFPLAFKGFFYGRNLNLLAPDMLADYFYEAREFHEHLRQLIAGPLALTEHIAALLATLDDGRPVRAAPGMKPEDQYMFTTIRAHLTGGYIPPHFDNEQALRPSYEHVMAQVMPNLISFVVAFTAAEAGGALEVFDCRQDHLARTPMNTDRVADKPDIARLDRASLRLPAGSLMVLDSGRYLHRVSAVQGPSTRWTACSFMSLARDERATYCWG